MLIEMFKAMSLKMGRNDQHHDEAKMMVTTIEAHIPFTDQC